MNDITCETVQDCWIMLHICCRYDRYSQATTNV